MKSQYIHLLKTGVVVLAVAIGIQSHAQQIELLDANNFVAGIGQQGFLFYTDSVSGQSLLPAEVPKGRGSTVFYASAIIMSGMDGQGKHHFAGNNRLHTSNNYYNGPVSTNYDSLYDNLYSHNFKITRQQVDLHRAHGVPAPAISLDPAIKYWPAEGNPYIPVKYGVNIEHHMAPFVDVDGNNIYDPVYGDYPAFCGEQAAFFVYNNERGNHDSTADNSHLGFEVRALAEQFLLPAEPLDKNAVNNAFFVHYEIENKSANNYSDFFIAMNIDPDVGCYSNDAIGCDTARRLAYAYNRTGYDNDCQGIIGYHNLHTAAGVQRLDAPLSSFGFFTNGGTFDQLNYYYSLRGMWSDGVPYTEGGVGRGGTVNTKYIYPGTPTDLNTWSEVSAGTVMGDRRMLACSGPDVFVSGQVKTFDYAFFASYDSTSTAQAIVDTVRRDAGIIQAFYNNQLLPCRALTATGIADTKNNLLQISVYPNPATSQLMVQAQVNITALQLTNLPGQVVLTAPGNGTKQVIDVSGLTRGIYLLKVKAGNKEAVRKVVVE